MSRHEKLRLLDIHRLPLEGGLIGVGLHALRVPVLVPKPSSQELDEPRFSPPLPS
jgi:hypothetical protein